MKRLISFGMTAAILLSLSGCRAGDTEIEDRNNGITNGGTNMGRTAGLNSNNNRSGYRDGIYVGYGNRTANGNERAIVTIRNGRIADVDLDRVSQQEGNNTGNAAAIGTDNPGVTDLSGTGPATRISTGMGNTAGTGIDNAYGTTAGTGTGSGTGNAAGVTADAVNRVRTNLANSIIENQRQDVNTQNNEINMRAVIDNWKLAVERALNQAR